MRSIYDGVLRSPGADFQAVYDGRRTPLRYVDVDLSTARSIAAGTPLILDVASDFFLADVDPVNQGEAVVHFQEMQLDKVSAPVYVTRGFTARMPFTRLLIENVAQAGKRLRFFFGVGIDMDPGGNNVTVSGSVSVIDGGKARTLAGTAFSGVALSTVAVGNHPRVQLWNPVGSGKYATVSQVIVGSDATQALYGAINAGAIGGLIGTVKSKLGGGVAGATELRGDSDPGGIPGNTEFLLGVIASTTATYKLTEPIVLTPGTGLVVWGSGTNVNDYATFELVEEAI